MLFYLHVVFNKVFWSYILLEYGLQLGVLEFGCPNKGMKKWESKANLKGWLEGWTQSLTSGARQGLVPSDHGPSCKL